MRLFEQGIEAGNPQPITPEDVATMHPTLAPDASSVLAGSLEPASVFRLYPLGGGDSRSVPGLGEGDRPLRFDATGRFVFVQQPTPLDDARAVIVRIDTRTGYRAPWLDLRPADRVGIGPITLVRLSADGGSYVYTNFRELSNLFLVEGLR